MNRNKTILIYFLSLFVFITNMNAQSGKIEGRVFDANTNEPLPFTNIIIFETTIGSTSDLDGKFIFTGIKPGIIRLRATSVGYEPYVSPEIQVTNAKTVYIDIPLKAKAIQLENVVITASPFKKVEESPLSMRTLGLSEIEKSPGANRDISKVIQSLPGVATTVSFRNDVIVRGGGTSENRFYLDGVEIPNLNHFATQGTSGGPVGIINVDFVREADFYSSSFPANRGNSLSSVLDFRLIDGNPKRINTRMTLGASDLGLTLDGPVSENTTMIFSARRSYLQFLFDVIGLPFLPIYNDFQFKTKTRFDLKNELTIIGLGAIDDFELNTGIENPDERQKYILNYLPVFKQWNYTIGAVYKHFGKNGYDTWVISRNMLRNQQFKYKNNDESLLSNKILDYNSDEIENKFRYEHSQRVNQTKIIYGGGLEYAKYLNNTYQQIFVNNTLKEINYDAYMQLFKWHLFGQITKEYLDNRLSVSTGLRTDGNTYSSSMQNPLNQLSPRLSASYFLTEKLKANAHYGIYYQTPAYTTLGFKDNSGQYINKKNNIKSIRAMHYVAGLEYQPRMTGRISLESFYKQYSRYPFSVKDRVSLANKGGDFGTFGDEEVTSTSKGRAYGVELFYQEKNIKGFNILFTYTFVRSEFTQADGHYIPSAWDSRHLINTIVSRKFKKDWYVGVRWKYAGGTPYTPYDLNKSSLKDAWDVRGQAYLDYNNFNSLRLKSYHQLDLRIDKEFFLKKWSLMLYLDIQNVYNFKADQPDYLVQEFGANGQALTDPNDPNRYKLKYLKNESGNILPTIGIMLEF